ncbi:RHS repeat domain-containing protein [Streptomyces sp. NPDC045456]|uniref:RHS repeat domain-containing protein n=1 Tax=Streptomyces sp. NPDC045456 TaxID=3155254 RepID=UPI003402BAF7
MPQDGNLTSVTGTATVFEYDDAHRMTAWIDTNGSVTTTPTTRTAACCPHPARRLASFTSRTPWPPPRPRPGRPDRERRDRHPLSGHQRAEDAAWRRARLPAPHRPVGPVRPRPRPVPTHRRVRPGPAVAGRPRCARFVPTTGSGAGGAGDSPRAAALRPGGPHRRGGAGEAAHHRCAGPGVRPRRASASSDARASSSSALRTRSCSPSRARTTPSSPLRRRRSAPAGAST